MNPDGLSIDAPGAEADAAGNGSAPANGRANGLAFLAGDHPGSHVETGAGAPHERASVAWMRRGLDIVAAGALLVILSPLLAAIAAAIKLDSRGPVLFRQRRVGYREASFTFYKFRTMGRDADPEPHREYVRQLIGGDSHSHNGLYKLAVDDRVTRVGAVLRRMSLDELPQLLNVIRGDMTLVGPRPVIPYEVELYPDWYKQRFSVKPGMTGLWQVSGRNERTYDEMIRLDIEFASGRSFRRDLGILARTPWVVLRRRGAA